MDTHTTRASLLSRVRDPADRAAWVAFESRYGELMLRYARARGLQYADAEDVRQSALLKLAGSLRRFEYDPARGRFRDYLGRVVQNVVRNYLSRSNPAGLPVDTSVLTALPDSGAADVDSLWEQEWMDHHCRLAMETVRRTFEPRSVEIFDELLTGKTLEEIATARGMTAAAVNMIRQRIRARTHELVAAQIREEDEPTNDRPRPV
jgi:RNA polymerase sigma factor (sigma-70 family)